MVEQILNILAVQRRIFFLSIAVVIGVCKIANGQTLIGLNDFDGTVSLGVVVGGAQGTVVTGSSAAGDRPASSTFYSSINTAASTTNGTGTVTSSNVTGLATYISKYFTFRLASWSIGSTGNGADAADLATIAISLDGGSTYSNEITVAGNANAYWHYSTGTGVASVTYDGDNTPTAFAPAGGANRTTDGYSTVTVNLPDACTQARIRITLFNNAAAERWTVDDVALYGTLSCTPPADPAGTITPASNPACTNTTLTYSAASATTYWQTSATGTSTAQNTTTAYTVTTSGTYYVREYNGSCWSTNSVSSAAITINTAPSISVHPSTSTQTLCSGGTTTALSVTAAGTGLTYQWYSNTANLNSGGSSISGATSSSYTPSNSLVGTTYYYCVVTGTCGSATSNVSGSVTVNALPADPAGTISPASNPACTNTTLTYSAASATTYWQTSATGTGTAQNTTTAYTVTTSGTYYVRTYNGTCWSTNSVSSAAITINTVPSLTGNPSNATATVGSTATFTVSATGTSLTYQWYENQGSGWNSITNGGIYSGATGATLTLTGVTLAMSGYQYYCVVSGTCAPTANSTSATLTVVTTAVGDYRTIASGNWGVNTTWEKWNGAAWVACSVGDFPDIGTASATIRNGHTVDNDGAGTPPWDVLNLTVESGGKLWDNAFTGANSYIQVYGNIICDGTIGTPAGDDISFDIVGGTNCTISGSGSFTATRIRKDANINPNSDVTLTINMDVLLTWNSASGTVLYNDGSTSNYNVTVAAGKTLRGTGPGSNVGNIAIDGANFGAPDAANSGGTYTIYGTMDVDGIIYAYTNNTTAGRSCNYIIKNGGTIKCRYVNAAASGSAGNTFTIENGGRLNIFGSVDTITASLVDTTWRNYSTTNNTYDFQSGSIVEYSGARQQRLNGHSTAYKNIVISGGAVKVLGLDVTASESLTLTSGVVQTGSYKMILSNTASAGLVHTTGSASFINGNFRRYITSNTSTYDLPLGFSNAATGYHRANFLNGNITGVTYLDTYVNAITETGQNIDANIATSQSGVAINDVDNTCEWNITPDAAASGGNYGVDLYVVNISGLTDDQFFVVKRPNASTTYADWNTFDATTFVPTAGTNGRITSGGAGYATRNNYTSFSKFAIGKIPPVFVLPSESVDFKGKQINGSVKLTWTACNMANAQYFEIMKSNDGNSFSLLGTVNARNTACGNYDLWDENPIGPVQYYRLYSVDQNGNRLYHNTIAINIGAEKNETTIQINYAETEIIVGLKNYDENSIIKLFDMKGQMLRTLILKGSDNNTLIINKSEFAKGIYLVSLQNSEGVSSEKIIIE